MHHPKRFIMARRGTFQSQHRSRSSKRGLRIGQCQQFPLSAWTSGRMNQCAMLISPATVLANHLAPPVDCLRSLHSDGQLQSCRWQPWPSSCCQIVSRETMWCTWKQTVCSAAVDRVHYDYAWTLGGYRWWRWEEHRTAFKSRARGTHWLAHTHCFTLANSRASSLASDNLWRLCFFFLSLSLSLLN